MICSETQVQIKQSGASVPAGSLRAGDTVYDGFSGRSREIMDVRRRCIGPNPATDLAPVVIRWGTLGRGQPTRDVYFSPEQQFLSLFRQQDTIPYLESYAAKDVRTELGPQTCTLPEDFTYVALFFDAPCYLVCSGIITLGYTPGVFAEYQQPSRRRA